MQMSVDNSLPDNLKITKADLADTPPAVLELVRTLATENAELRKRVEKLEAKLRENSSNSNKPSSSNSPYDENEESEEKKKKSQSPRKKRKGFRQKFMSPTETQDVNPATCSCGCSSFKNLEPYYTHQYIELPEIVMSVTHLTLYRGECSGCEKTGKGYVPREFRAGFGPRFTALVGEISGIDGNSRETVQTFCSSVFGVPVSLGAIQKIIDRASAAVKPHYETIRDVARSRNVNYLDETTWKKGRKLHWLWVMTNSTVAYFMIHRHRSKKAFEQLIGTWEGILVSDGYRLYQSWANGRQTCLAHLIRRAQGLSERDDPELAKCGKWAAAELRRLCKMAKDPPTHGEWSSFYARLCRLIALYRDCDSDAGTFVRHIEDEMDSLFTFLLEKDVDPTNNFAERMIRFAVLWRKRSQGTKSDKGNRWVERILSLRQTCRLQGKSTFEVLTDAVRCYFRQQTPDLEWISQAT